MLTAGVGEAAAQIRKVGPEFQVNTKFIGDQVQPDVGITKRGRFTIVWAGIFEDHHEHGFGIWGRSFDKNGHPLAEQFLVTDTEEFDDWSETDPAIDCALGPRCTVGWLGSFRDNGDVNLVGTKSLDPLTQLTGASLQASTRSEVSVQWLGAARTPVGVSMIVWNDAGPIFDLDPLISTGRIIGADGSALTPPFALSSVTDDSRQPQVIALSNGDFLTTWWGRDATGDYNVYVRRFNDSGQALGEEFRVNEMVTGAQQRPALAATDDGGFLAVWESGAHEDEQFVGIYARRFGPNDAPIGPEHHVNTFTVDSQVVPAVENDGVGGFVVAWVSYSSLRGPGQDGDGPGVFGRRLHDDGSPDGLEFQINTTTDFAQGWITWPIGLAARNGQVIATWQDERLGRFVFDIFAQRFTLTPGAGPVCGDAHAQDLRLDLRDALQILRGATGLRPCLACLCDADGSGSVAAGDALVVLRTAVGIGVTSQCPACQEGDESPAGAFGFGFPESDD